MKPRPSRAQYAALAFYIAISFGYYAAGVIALREEWFHPAKYARVPIDVNDTTQVIGSVEKEAKSAGLSKGDILKALNGEPFTGDYQLFTNIHQARPGDNLAVTIRGAGERERTVSVRLAPREGPTWDASAVALFITILFLPLS